MHTVSCKSIIEEKTAVARYSPDPAKTERMTERISSIFSYVVFNDISELRRLNRKIVCGYSYYLLSIKEN